MKYGIYIHIPFCRKKCDYCNFYSIAYNPEKNSSPLKKYTERLIKELSGRLKNFSGDSADTIFFGGGTPSLCTPGEIRRIISFIRDEIYLEPDAEVSIEINPEDLSADKLEGYREAGVSRFVLGMQTLSEKLNGIIGRSGATCSPEKLELFFSHKNITHCIDLITGIPAQDLPELEKDLKTLACFMPEHVSAYTLSIEKGTPLHSRIRHDPEFDDHQRFLFEETIKRLKIIGYRHYEISNFALNGFECRHNMKYWTFDPYLGFGTSSHSFFNDERFCNNMSVAEYLSSENVTLTRDERSENAMLVEYLMTGLRLINGISLNKMQKRLEREVPTNILDRINFLREKGLLSVELNNGDRIIRLKGDGLMFADSVIYQIVEQLL